MWKSLASLFSFDAFTPRGIASSLHSLTSNDIFPLVTYAQDSLPHRTAPRRAPGGGELLAPKTTSGSMLQLTSQVGLCLRPVASLTPVDVLRNPALGGLSRSVSHGADRRVAARSTVTTVHFDCPPIHSATVSQYPHDNGTTLRHTAEEVDLALAINLKVPLLNSIWQTSNVEPLRMESLVRDRTSGLITREDAQKSIPVSYPTLREQDNQDTGQQIIAHNVHYQHADRPCGIQHGDGLCGDVEAAHPVGALGLEVAAGKRIASFQSSSDASTRRSSIWDDDYDGEIEDDDASDVTDISSPHDDSPCNAETYRTTPPEARQSSSQLGYSDPQLAAPNLHHSNITVIRSPHRRRSSHPALLLLQADNSHLRADQARIRDENARLQAVNTQLASENGRLISQNSSLHASLTSTTKSIATAYDTIATQDLQLHSLRRRVSFLERWVDSLHEEKVALHEENMALEEVGSVRAQAVNDLRVSYERLEDVVEKAVVSSKKPHDCALEVELEGVRGRLGGLRIVS